MSADDVDNWLSRLDGTKRATLEQLRRDILTILPEAVQGLAYGVPAFRHKGKLIAGFSAAKGHLSYLPHSGSVLASMDSEALAGFEWSKGALRFEIGSPLACELVEKLVMARLAELQL
jgi:uncharacterized protein YdhG (YjbR/CyaY superfamily)